ncbi:MAG: (deoxy)nucleoside triphosphate pyrophosphohydrolase [Bacteroidales bacterium]
MGKTVKVVAAIVVNEGKILCVKRGLAGYSYIAGRYEFPGGKIEAGEDAQEALHREIFEELDIEIEIISEYMTVNHTYPDFEIVLQTFICTNKRGDITLREHSDYKWLSPDKLDTLKWAQADYPIVEKLISEADTI